MRQGQTFQLEVQPNIPEKLRRLEELAGNLWYSWDRATRTLFARLNPTLWDAVGHSPKAMLKRVDEARLEEVAADPIYLNRLNRVLAAYDLYHEDGPLRIDAPRMASDDLVAYFCAEFGFHASLPIYSGGLGILAGDHCKAASDMHLPLVGVGLLYRQGYFNQRIDAEGHQQAEYFNADFDDLPIQPVLDGQGVHLAVHIPMAERSVEARVWQARIGHVKLYLLDTDVPGNSTHDRGITWRLYGGDSTTRIEQEIVLGVGGVRALAAIGLNPTVWHINEGHAAFQILERLRLACATGQDFKAALEAVAANTVFTTHTPVPAGHDHFPVEMVERYFARHASDMNLPMSQLVAMGRTGTGPDFNMTALAVRGARFHNGVSRIHGEVSQRILSEFWPQVPPEENPIGYVTNGVHMPTFLAPQWLDIFDRFLGFGWSQRINDPATWANIHAVPDYIFWSVRQDLKAQLLHLVRHRLTRQHLRNQGAEAQLKHMLRHINPDQPRVLTVGFGRRFATYKRATLLFNDLERLQKIVTNPERPVVFIFAGKAHPADKPGQDLIRTIHRVARMPEFIGHILLVEDYDLRLARRMVSGVDVWLNNPIYPLEASGTSGMKAAMNGVLNLSVLDGWWGEGYDGENGWAIRPSAESMDPDRRDQNEAQALYALLEDEIVPLFYTRNDMGMPQEWIRRGRHAIASLLPRYSAARMLDEYVGRFYLPASRQGRRYSADNGALARSMASWRERVQECWAGVRARVVESAPTRLSHGQGLCLAAAVQLNGLAASDVAVELLLGDQPCTTHRLQPDDSGHEGEVIYRLDLLPDRCGRLDYRIRITPHHEALAHPMETGLVYWI